jgi:radical SAM protein (TIGR01212 family)
MYDETLKKINRGHDFQSYLKALEMTKNRGIQICTHLILGFPWETTQQWSREAEVLSGLPIDFLKIHHLHIVKGTVLGYEYQNESFELLSYPQYIDVVCSFLEKLNPAIIIQRLFGQTPAGLLLAPQWEKNSAEMVYDINLEFERRDSWQGKKYKPVIS